MVGFLMLMATAYVVLVLLGTAGLVRAVLWPTRRTMGVALAKGCPVQPSDLGLSGQEVTFNLSDGSASPGFIVDGERGDGPVAVVLHGYTDSRYGALYRAELLAPFVSHTVVFDLPAHGDAEAAMATFGQREPADVAAVVEGLPTKFTGRPVVLYGYSMGGHIAVRAAAEDPRYAGVVAVSPYRYWDDGLRNQMRRRGLPSWPIVPLAGWWIGLRWRTRLGTIDRTKDAARLQCPLLVLHGTADDICPLEAGRAIATSAPRGRLYEVEGGTHNQLLAEDYNGIVAELRRFFEEVAAEASKDASEPSQAG